MEVSFLLVFLICSIAELKGATGGRKKSKGELDSLNFHLCFQWSSASRLFLFVYIHARQKPVKNQSIPLSTNLKAYVKSLLPNAVFVKEECCHVSITIFPAAFDAATFAPPEMLEPLYFMTKEIQLCIVELVPSLKNKESLFPILQSW